MIVVLADDLSGAAELAGAALRHGLSAEVQTVFSPDTAADVICVDTDTRLLSPEQAAHLAEAVTRNVVAAQPAWIFKKCDSVLRGPVLAEARAMARAAGQPRIMVLSANPSRGRVIRHGNYFVDGQPLHQTVFARDPAHPRTTARVAEMLGCDLAEVETPDAETVAAVARHAAAVDANTLPVGAADFFSALLAIRIPPGVEDIPHSAFRTPHSPGPTLVVCGSAASWAQRQASATAHGIPIFTMPVDADAVIRTLQARGQALVGIGNGPATLEVRPEILVSRLAAAAAAILSRMAVPRLLLEGGATAAAVIRTAGWTRLSADASSAPGIGVLRPAGAAGPALLVKPGSYAWPPEIWPLPRSA